MILELTLTLLIVGFVLLVYYVLGKSMNEQIAQDAKLDIILDLSSFEKNGYGTFSGNIEPLNEYLKEPISQLDCVYYSIRTNNVNGDQFSELLKDIQYVPFLVKNEDTYAFVLPENSSVITTELHYKSSGPETTTNTYEAYLSEKKMNRSKSFEVRVSTSKMLKIGELIKIKSIGEWKSPKELGLNLAVNRVLVLSSNSDIQMEIESLATSSANHS